MRDDREEDISADSDQAESSEYRARRQRPVITQDVVGSLC
jgi:hypothetical protein